MCFRKQHSSTRAVDAAAFELNAVEGFSLMSEISVSIPLWLWFGEIRDKGFNKRDVVFLTGNAGLRPHFPAQFEHMEDRGEIAQEEEGEEEVEEEGGRGHEDDRLAEGPAEQAGMSVEVQIGRKLREIGDKFQQDHVEMVSFTPTH